MGSDEHSPGGWSKYLIVEIDVLALVRTSIVLSSGGKFNRYWRGPSRILFRRFHNHDSSRPTAKTQTLAVKAQTLTPTAPHSLSAV